MGVQVNVRYSSQVCVEAGADKRARLDARRQAKQSEQRCTRCARGSGNGRHGWLRWCGLGEAKRMAPRPRGGGGRGRKCREKDGNCTRGLRERRIEIALASPCRPAARLPLVPRYARVRTRLRVRVAACCVYVLLPRAPRRVSVP